MPTVNGTFDVKLQPLPVEDIPAEAVIGRRSIDKQFHGPLDATSKGQMLSTGSASGSGVYVALERVTGTLEGKRGSFALHHTGIMDRGTPTLEIRVAPDSGTDELTGITGTLTIDIRDGAHFYGFDYTLPSRDSDVAHTGNVIASG